MSGLVMTWEQWVGVGVLAWVLLGIFLFRADAKHWIE
jgi:hypothetical protein